MRLEIVDAFGSALGLCRQLLMRLEVLSDYVGNQKDRVRVVGEYIYMQCWSSVYRISRFYRLIGLVGLYRFEKKNRLVSLEKKTD